MHRLLIFMILKIIFCSGDEISNSNKVLACNNKCPFANDGECDDGGSSAIWGDCSFGEDCFDCGERQISVGTQNNECNYASLKSLTSPQVNKPEFNYSYYFVNTSTQIDSFIPLIDNSSKFIKVWNDPGQVVGGEYLRKNEFSFLVGLVVGNFPYCGGVLIDKKFVVTAAHCVSSRTSGQVLIGAHDFSSIVSNTDNCVERINFKVFAHPDYSNLNFQNDIALLELDRESSYERIPQIMENIDDNAAVVVMGWGRTSRSTSQYEIDKIAKKVGLYISNENTCKQAYRFANQISITPSMICAGDPTSNVGSCQGDSGGPLIVDQVNTQKGHGLVGLVSFASVPCASKNFPTVYTRVSSYKEWMCEIMCERSTCDICETKQKVIKIFSFSLQLICLDCSFAYTVQDLGQFLRQNTEANIIKYETAFIANRTDLKQRTYMVSNFVQSDVLLNNDLLIPTDNYEGIALNIEYNHTGQVDVVQILNNNTIWNANWLVLNSNFTYPPVFVYTPTPSSPSPPSASEIVYDNSLITLFCLCLYLIPFCIFYLLRIDLS